MCRGAAGGEEEDTTNSLKLTVARQAVGNGEITIAVAVVTTADAPNVGDKLFHEV
jgi:hypothetical protein